MREHQDDLARIIVRRYHRLSGFDVNAVIDVGERKDVDRGQGGFVYSRSPVRVRQCGCLGRECVQRIFLGGE